jgi:predicted SAM-dependent methyltransferase
MTQYANRTGLMIAVPLSGNPIVADWAFSFAQLHPPMNYNIEYSLVKGMPVAEARNHLARSAVQKNCKYLFFIDEDVTPPAHTVRQLIYHLEHWPRAAVAGGIYCHKSPPSFPMVFRGNGAGSYWGWKIGEVFDCSGLGCGCMMIRVDALKTIPEPWFKTVDDVEKFMDGINQGEMWTEDLYFCDKVTKATGEGVPEGGWQILADGGILPNHWDTRTGTAYNLPPTSSPLKRVGWELGVKKIVDLGCGPLTDSYQTDEGKVLRVDIREDVHPDYRCDLRKTPFANHEFDIVFSSHTLEHFARTEVPEVLDEWTRIMKPDGELRFVLPNIKWAAKHIMNDEIDKDVLNVLYGAQTYDENFHKMGFTPQIVEQLLVERGFTKFVWDHHNYHMSLRAWKVEPKEIGPVAPIVREEQLRTAVQTPMEQDPASVPQPTAELVPLLNTSNRNMEMEEEMKAALGG